MRRTQIRLLTNRSLCEFWNSWGPWRTSDQETVSGIWKSQSLLRGSESLVRGYAPPNTSLSFFIQSLYKEETRTEIVQFPLYKGNSKAQSFDPFQLRQYQTWPWGPSTFSFSPGLEKPPNFTIETNIFIQLQMLELNTHTSRTSTSPFCSFGQVICFSLFFSFLFFIMPLMQSRATDYKEAVWLQQ